MSINLGTAIALEGMSIASAIVAGLAFTVKKALDKTSEKIQAAKSAILGIPKETTNASLKARAYEKQIEVHEEERRLTRVGQASDGIDFLSGVGAVVTTALRYANTGKNAMLQQTSNAISFGTGALTTTIEAGTLAIHSKKLLGHLSQKKLLIAQLETATNEGQHFPLDDKLQAEKEILELKLECLNLEIKKSVKDILSALVGVGSGFAGAFGGPWGTFVCILMNASKNIIEIVVDKRLGKQTMQLQEDQLPKAMHSGVGEEFILNLIEIGAPVAFPEEGRYARVGVMIPDKYLPRQALGFSPSEQFESEGLEASTSFIETESEENKPETPDAEPFIWQFNPLSQDLPSVEIQNPSSVEIRVLS